MLKTIIFVGFFNPAWPSNSIFRKVSCLEQVSSSSSRISCSGLSLGMAVPSSTRDWQQLFRNLVQAHFNFIFSRNFSGSLLHVFSHIQLAVGCIVSILYSRERSSEMSGTNSAMLLSRTTGQFAKWTPRANSSPAASGLNFVYNLNKTEKKTHIQEQQNQLSGN